MPKIIKREEQVQFRFTVLDDDGKTEFSDAIYYPTDQWPVPLEEMDRAAMARFDVWQATHAQVAAENAAQAVVDGGSPMSADDQRAASLASLKETASALAQQSMDFNEKVQAL